VAGRVSIVSFEHGKHESYYATDGRSLFEAVRNAMRFFRDPYWRGPKPGRHAILTVALVGDEREWQVRGDRVAGF
jgi:hypothetical protein